MPWCGRSASDAPGCVVPADARHVPWPAAAQRQAARHLHGGCPGRPTKLGAPRREACRGADLPRVRNRSHHRHVVEAVRDRPATAQRPRRHHRLRAAAPAGIPATQSAAPRGREPGLRVQHRDQLRDEYELAGVLGRVNDGVPRPDGGPDRTELPVCRDRHRGRHCTHPRLRAPLHRHDRQLLGRRDAFDALRPAAALDRAGAGVREPGCDPELRRLQGRPDGRGGDLPGALHGRLRKRDPRRRWRYRDDGSDDPDADPANGARRLAGSDQGTRHQWRRILQHELGAPLREPDSADEPAADAVHPADPVRAHLHVRARRR